MNAEIAFVVAMDRVRSSPQPMERKAAMSSELTEAIGACPAYLAAKEVGQVITLDSGDGAALVFFGDPLSAMHAALEVQRAVNYPGCHSPLRVGVHTGPVIRRTDVAGKPNVDGHGIDMAFRAMAVADGSAVVVTEAYAAILVAFEEWAARLNEPEDHLVKHDRVSVCRVLDAAQEPKAGDGLRVSIVYKRHAQPDGALLAKLEARLRAGGFRVFVDRHMSIGVEWAHEIERQLRASDAVIALLSDRAGDSEMMLYELQTACDERDKSGKPAILPVRVGSDAPLGGEIGRLVSRYHYFHWSRSGDDERLWSEIDAALRKPPDPPASLVAPIEQPGGAVPLDSPYYIERSTDAQFAEAIARRDSIVLLKGARQMGKTSLLARGLNAGRARGWQIVLTDFQTFSSSQLETDERLYRSLMHAFRTQLKLDVDLEWNDWLGANTNLEHFIQTRVLPQVDGHLIWAMDEADRLFSRPYAGDFFGLVRSWHNRRPLEPQGSWQRMTMAISYATEAHLFITDLNQSPFNVGTRLGLTDFSVDQVRALNDLYGKALRTEEEVRQFFDLLNGQPYLTRRALDELVRDGHSLAQVIELADHDEGIFGDHLRRIMVALSNDSTLATAVLTLLGGKSIESEPFYRLRAGGVIRGDSVATATFRCRIYETYLRRHLS